MSMSIKKGDTVVVITGKEKGKSGKVTDVSPKNNRVLVDGVNIVTKHQKARKQNEKSQIVKKSAPMEASNVMVICPACGKATRIAHSEIEGKKVRSCKKCKASLDKEFVKVAKKEAKKASTKSADEKPAKKVASKEEVAPKVTAEKKTTTKKSTKTTSEKKDA